MQCDITVMRSCLAILTLRIILTSALDMKERTEAEFTEPGECTAQHIQGALTGGSSCRPITKVVKLPLPANNSVAQMTPQFIEVSLCGGGCHNTRQSCVSIAKKVRRVPVILSKCELGATGRCGKQCTTLTVEEDTQCRCDCLAKQEKCTHPRHVFNRDICDCECENKDAEKQCRDQGRVWSIERCVCSCPTAVIKPCSTGYEFDYDSSCSCIPIDKEQKEKQEDRVERSQEGITKRTGRGQVELIIIVSLSGIAAVFFLIILSLLQNIKKLKETIKKLSMKHIPMHRRPSDLFYQNSSIPRSINSPSTEPFLPQLRM